MDPVGTVQAVISAINYLYQVASKVKENRQECRRLCSHARSMLDLIQTECKDGIPNRMQPRLAKLAK